MSVFEVDRQRRFSTRCRAAERTRFFCCLMFGIGVKTPALAGLEMVAAAGEACGGVNLPAWTTSGAGATADRTPTAGRATSAAVTRTSIRRRKATVAPATTAARRRTAAQAKIAAPAADVPSLL